MSNWVSYKNGNYTVHIDLDNGTKIRENDKDFFEAGTVENFDLAITYKCTRGCKFCFIGSTPEGKHADIMSPSFIDKLHPYTEIAIGGGNPLEHPDLVPFLKKLKKLKQIPSMTVNQLHFEENFDLLKNLCETKLIYGLGISLVNPTEAFIEKVRQLPNAVVHVIAGVVSEAELNKLANNGLKILILGYKVMGRGLDYYTSQSEEISKKIKWLSGKLKEFIDNKEFKTISFDNRALIQLHVKDIVSKETWDAYYMGNDGLAEDEGYTSSSMFIDMVDRTFAVNSCSQEKTPLLDTIEDMFNSLKERYAA